MKEIILTNNYKAIIDDDDFDLTKGYNWLADIIKSKNNTYIYAAAYIQKQYKRTGIYLHRLIIGARSGEFVDHINGNTLDCRKCNLRLCSTRQNNQNQRVIIGIIKYKGVHKSGNRFRARIRLNNGIRLDLGTYKTAEEAAKAYDRKATEDRGEFAVTNFDLNGNFNSTLRIKGN